MQTQETRLPTAPKAALLIQPPLEFSNSQEFGLWFTAGMPVDLQTGLAEFVAKTLGFLCSFG
jgi:hypothetical protein